MGAGGNWGMYQVNNFELKALFTINYVLDMIRT